MISFLFLLIIRYAHHPAPSLCDTHRLWLSLDCHYIWLLNISFVPHWLARLAHHNLDFFLLIAEISTASAQQNLRPECLRLVRHLLLRGIVPQWNALLVYVNDLLTDLDEWTHVLVSVLYHLLILLFLLLHLH